MGPARLTRPQQNIYGPRRLHQYPAHQAQGFGGRRPDFCFGFTWSIEAAFPWPLHLLAVLGGRFISRRPVPQARSADLGAVENQINPMEFAALYRMLDLLFPFEPLLPLEPELPPPDPEPEPLDPPELPVEVLAVPADAAVAPLLP